MRLAPSLSIDWTLTRADCQVRATTGRTTAKLAMMINVRMFTPSRERLPPGQRCALNRDVYCHYAFCSSKLARFLFLDLFLEALLVTSLNVLIEYTLSFPSNHWIGF